MSRGIKLTAVYECYLWLCAFLMLPMAKARGLYDLGGKFLSAETNRVFINVVHTYSGRGGVHREHLICEQKNVIRRKSKLFL